MDLFGKPRRIGCGLERVAGDQRRGLMVLSTARSRWCQAGDDIRAHCANQPDEVAEDFFPAPLLERLLDAERKAEIDRPREVLLGPVETMNRGEFFGSKYAERFEQLGTDLVLAAVPSGGR